MTKRIFLSTLLTAAAALLLSIVLVAGVMYGHLKRAQRTELAEATGQIGAGVAMGGMDYLASLPEGDTRLTWIAADGTVLFDSAADAATLENHAGREEVREALLSQTGESARYSSTLAETTFYHAQRLPDGTVLRTARTQRSAFALLWDTAPALLLVLLATAALAGALSGWAARRIVRPINDIDLVHPERGEAYDELAPLMRRLVLQQREIAAQMEAVQHGEETLRAITENMNEGFLALDVEGRVVTVNESAARLLHADRTHACGQKLIALHRGETLLHAAEEALSGRAASATLTPDGRTVALYADPVRSGRTDGEPGAEGGWLTGAVLFLVDETERAQAEQLRREFSANVSHELKTPLTSISGYAELIASGMAAPEDVAGFAARIHSEAGRLLTLIEDVMNLSRLDEGSMSEAREDVNLRTLAAEVAARFDAAAAARGVQITVTGCDAQVTGVRHVLDEMLFNLIDNAVKYNVEGGSVTVSVQDAPEGARLTVSDTGIGIPPEHQAKVFERFYRVDKSHSKQTGGTGLGLSIVKHGAALHGAAVQLESEEGRGTRITLRFKR